MYRCFVGMHGMFRCFVGMYRCFVGMYRCFESLVEISLFNRTVKGSE